MENKENNYKDHQCLIIRFTNQFPFPRCRYCTSNFRSCFMMQSTLIILAVIILFLLVLNITHPMFHRLGIIGIIGLLLGMAILINHRTEELKFGEHKLREINKELSKSVDYNKYINEIIASMIDPLIVATTDGTIRTVNKSLCYLLLYKEEELKGKEITLLLPEEERETFLVDIFEKIIKEGEYRNYETNLLAKDGKVIPILYSGSLTKDINGNISEIVCLVKDITERKFIEEKLKHMAYHDQLTNLPNRANFLSYLRRMLQRTEWRSDYLFAVLFIDLDRFKVVNDSLGHLIGDKLLIEVAHRLEECTRPTDRISRVAGNDRVSRFGGDEFALFLHDIKDISSASRVADRIQMKIQKPFMINGHELFTSASIGIALSATGYENAEDILRDADSAMYYAKDTGKAHAEIFDDEMRVKVTEILQLESDLRAAVEKEQFMVYYQPIVSATDSRITGTEALIRWNHPEKGFISPMDFIPIAEETGLILMIGEWVLRTACAQNKAWQDAGYSNLLMKVNFSSRQFKDENLTEVVTKVIRETGMPAPLLDVEITESIAIAESSIRILNQLTAMGVQTSIDDFGTGYSSLGSLTKFPINTIKIDRCFVKDITTDVNAKAIIKAIIAMAHSLNMEVVAEGVETEEQLAFLQSQKCDKIQGYLFSPPVPEDDFRKLLEKEKNGSSIIQKHSKSMV